MKIDNFWESEEAVGRYTTKPELWDSEIRFIFKAVQNLGKNISNIKILDLGCGGGRTTIPLFKMGFDITGLDISASLINELKKKSPKINAIVGDAAKLPFEKSSFDIVIFSHNSLDCLETIDDRVKCLKEINRVLKSNGYFVFSSHYFNLIPTDFHVAFTTLRNLLRYIFNRKKGFYYEIMENKSEIKYYYSDIDEVEKSLNKIGFKIVEYTSMVDTSKNKIKDFLKSITTWEIYYLFEKKIKDLN